MFQKWAEIDYATYVIVGIISIILMGIFATVMLGGCVLGVYITILFGELVLTITKFDTTYIQYPKLISFTIGSLISIIIYFIIKIIIIVSILIKEKV